MTTVLLYADVYSVTNVPVASSLLKQIIILAMVDNPASTMHIQEMPIESKRKLLVLKGNITEFNQWVWKQIGWLHAREQEAVYLLYYLWKAYKAAPDDEFVIYIKDLKSQSNDRRATFTAENLMIRTEDKYKARLLDEENAWGKPTDEQEKIVAMKAEINSLKKERRGTTNKKDKEKADTKKSAAKKTPARKTKEQKKKTNDKWAWKGKPPKETDSKQNNVFAMTFESKKYYWSKNHNNGAGMWTFDRIPSTNPGAEPPRDDRDSGSARSHSTNLETSSSDRP